MRGRNRQQEPAQLSDIELMTRVQQNDMPAFEVLMQRHQESLMNFFTRLGAHNDAEDLVQNSFLRLYKRCNTYRPSAKFTTYLYRIAKTVWIDWLRKKTRREDFLTQFEQDISHHSEQEFIPPSTAMDAQAALELLPAKLRVVVVMSIFQGFKYCEIAEALEIPMGTVKSRMALAVSRLRKFMHVHAES